MKMPYCSFVALASFLVSIAVADPIVIPVWPGVAPGSEGKAGDEKVRIAEKGDHVYSSIHRPSLTVMLPQPPAANHAAVLVIPGGGHREIWIDHEGFAIARALNERGFAAFILKYRLAREAGSTYTIEGTSLSDAQRALRLIKSRAKEFAIDPAKLGVIGFSAGGELAALLASRELPADPTSADAVEHESSRPAFQALVYPGNAKSIAPAAGAPPAFLLVGEKDAPGFSDELARVYSRFHAAGVSAELHIIAGQGHGFGLRPSNTGAAARWIDYFVDWMNAKVEAAPAPH